MSIFNHTYYVVCEFYAEDVILYDNDNAIKTLSSGGRIVCAFEFFRRDQISSCKDIFEMAEMIFEEKVKGKYKKPSPVIITNYILMPSAGMETGRGRNPDNKRMFIVSNNDD